MDTGPDTEISIEGIDPATLLMELHNGTSAIGTGRRHGMDRNMTIDEAHAWIEQHAHAPRLYVDYCMGRPLGCALGEPMMRTDLYDRYSHPGACAEAVERARAFEQKKIDAHLAKCESMEAQAREDADAAEWHHGRGADGEGV